MKEDIKEVKENFEEKSCSTCKFCYLRNSMECCQVDDCGELCIAYSSWETKE